MKVQKGTVFCIFFKYKNHDLSNETFVAGLSEISQQRTVSHDQDFTLLKVSHIISRNQYSFSSVTTPSSVLSAKLPMKLTT